MKLSGKSNRQWIISNKNFVKKITETMYNIGIINRYGLPEKYKAIFNV